MEHKYNKRLIIDITLNITNIISRIHRIIGSGINIEIKIIAISKEPKYLPTGSYTGFPSPDVAINKKNIKPINNRINGSYQPIKTKARKTSIIKVKSAVISKYDPIVEVVPILRAINPSSPSVIAAITRIISARTNKLFKSK